MSAPPLFFTHLPAASPRLRAGIKGPWAWVTGLLAGLVCAAGAAAGQGDAARLPGGSPADIPIQLRRSLPEIPVNLIRGYDKLQAGRLEEALHDYEKAWRDDPRNIDVLLGLASIAQRQGRSTDAENYYRLAVTADPGDPFAQAASIGLAIPADPVAAESRLKVLLAAQPQSAPLNFALGNAYVRQDRWAEAQQAYFNALAADSDNPDYRFNFAVALDHLHQPELAARHYRMALEAAGRRPAAFDREAVKTRLQDRLSQGVPSP